MKNSGEADGSRGSGQILRFGSFTLDELRGDLRRNGVAVEIQATPLRLLEYLVRNPGVLISHDELLDQVWKGVVVSDNAIATALKQLRLVLDDRGRDPPWIETRRGRGIRFNAAVEPVVRDAAAEASPIEHTAGESMAPDGRRRSLLRGVALASGALASLTAVLAAATWLSWPLALGLLLDAAGVTHPPIDPPPPTRPSIAVLPFANLEGDPTRDYFSDGISEELTNDLARNGTLFVVSRNSAFSYKGRAVDVRKIGKQLGVRYVVEGSVRRSGERVRITAQLIDATSGGHVYSERFDRELREIFELQSEIAEKLTAAMRSEIHDVELGELWRRGTQSVQAHDALLEGWAHLRSFRRQRVTVDARRLAQRAIELDPEYPEAYLLLGATYSVESLHGWNDDSTLHDRWRELTLRARALDPSAHHGDEGLATEAVRNGRPEEALAFADSAVAARPNLAVAHIARADALVGLGRPLAAIGAMRTAIRLDPRDVSVAPLMYAAVNLLAGRKLRAVEYYEQARHSNPDLVIPRAHLAAWYEANGDHAKASEIVGEILAAVPEMSAERGARYVRPSLCENAHEWLRRAGLPDSSPPVAASASPAS